MACALIAVVGGIVFFLFSSAPRRMAESDGASLGNDVTAEGTPVLVEATEPDIPEEVTVPILVYHYIREPRFGPDDPDRQYEVSPQVFSAQLLYIKEQGFETIHMSDIAAAFTEGKPLPEKPVIISFDDGRDSQYTAAFPLLKEYGFTASFFVFTNAMDRPGYLTWDQLAEMRDAGMEIGSHGIYHPYLTRLSDEEMRAELFGSRAKLREMLGVPGDVIAYPFGLNDERVRSAAAEAGYAAGRDLDHVVTHAAEDALTLGSYIATSDMSWFRRIIGGTAK